MSEVSEEEMGFIRAVLANPDDDAIRLIYSDWLEEHERIPHFIRLQTDQRYSFVSTEHWLSNPRRALSAHEVSGPQESTIWIDITGDMVGFCEYIRCPAEWWLKHADEVTKYHPIREVHLTTWPQKNDIEHMLKGGHILATWILDDQSAQDHWNGITNTLWPNIKFVMPNNKPQKNA